MCGVWAVLFFCKIVNNSYPSESILEEVQYWMELTKKLNISLQAVLGRVQGRQLHYLPH